MNDANDDAVGRLPPELLEQYQELRRRFALVCKDIRKRHKGTARAELLLLHQKEHERQIQELLEGLKKAGSP